MSEQRAKYSNRKMQVDGRVFDSRLEARRYQELKLLEAAGEIRDLECQMKFPLVVNEIKIATYIADFVYHDCKTGRAVVEDVKSETTRTLPVFRIKKKLMKAALNIEVIEVL